jgi:hypothetical protein
MDSKAALALTNWFGRAAAREGVSAPPARPLALFASGGERVLTRNSEYRLRAGGETGWLLGNFGRFGGSSSES